MPDAEERRSRFAGRAKGASVDWAFFSACSQLHSALVHRPNDALKAKGRPLTPGEIGCYSSHYAVWSEFHAGDADQIIVLEDDTIVDWTLVAKLAQRNLAAEKLHYLRLFYKLPASAAVVRRDFIDRGRMVVELDGFVHGTQGYAMTRPAVERFLVHCRQVRRPIDNELDRSWAHGVPNLSLFPFALVEESAASTIGASRFERHPAPLWAKVARRGAAWGEELRRARQALSGYGRFRGGAR